MCVCVCLCSYAARRAYNFRKTFLSICNDTIPRTPPSCDMWNRQWRPSVRVSTVRILRWMKAIAPFVILTKMTVKWLFTVHLSVPEPQNGSFIILIKSNLSLMRCFRYMSTRRHLPSTHNYSLFPPNSIYNSYTFPWFSKFLCSQIHCYSVAKWIWN